MTDTAKQSERLTEARNAAGDATHEWFLWHGLESCKKCGIVRRADRLHKPCKGVVRVELRAALKEAQS